MELRKVYTSRGKRKTKKGLFVMSTNKKQTEAIYDAKTLGTGRTLVLGLQHMFAMFGATVLVPALTGLNVSTTLLFHLITGRKVPAFLGSSFAFLGAYGLATAAGDSIPLTYSSFGVAVAGLVYLVLALLFKIFGAKKVMRFFTPIVTGKDYEFGTNELGDTSVNFGSRHD